MTSEQKMWWLRFTEKLIVALILILACAGVFWFIFGSVGGTLVIQIGLAVLIILLVSLLFVQNTVDKYFESSILSASKNDTERFRSLYDRSPTPLITTAPDGRILQFNAAAIKLLQSTTDQLPGSNFFDFVTSHTGHDESVLPGKMHAGAMLIEEELSLRTVSGEEIWVLMSVYVDVQSQHRIVSLIDVTQAKRVDTAKSEFVALATHQLRTPIAAIRWNVELLAKKLHTAPSTENERFVVKINRNVHRMIALIDDFLSVSKLEMGTFAASDETINMSDFFTTILDEYTEKLTERQIHVTREELPPGQIFTSDSRLFHIIVSNLVSNAVKYLKEGGNLKLAYRMQNTKLIIEVIDDGIGIPKKEQEQLFKKFFRATNARVQQTEGTGLGLYIVEQSVKQLGGTITFQSDENVGTAFTIELPA